MRPSHLLVTLLCTGLCIVPSLSDSPLIWHGADVSFLPEVEEGGGVFHDAQGERPLPEILSDHGVNLARLQLWHTSDRFNLTTTIALAERLDAEGVGILIDFHFSDTWYVQSCN